MVNEKKSFLIYFDNAPMINGLPPEQRGWLFSALLDYGDRVSRENLSPEAALRLYPQLESQAQMAFRFIASTIDRDTQRWLQRQRAGEERRQAKAGERPSPAVPPASQALRMEQEDRERLRRVLEQARRET